MEMLGSLFCGSRAHYYVTQWFSMVRRVHLATPGSYNWEGGGGATDL